MSSAAVLDSAVAIRGGIPICFPWFGAGRSGDQAPSHGFARLMTWSLHEVVESDGAVTVTHELTDDAQTRALFPHGFTALHAATFGEQLDVRLRVMNTGDESFSYEAALHTYLRVGDARQVRIRGLDGVAYDDKVDGGEAKSQIGDVTFTSETDRIYFSGTGVDVVDPSLGRVIKVRLTDVEDTVVWNPWVARAAALSDFDDDGWRTMVCVEGANLKANAVELRPGEVQEMGYLLAVEKITADEA